MLDDLNREERLRLVKFVCSFAWADLEIQDDERTFVHRLATQLGLDDVGDQINRWLKSPPPAEEVDPTRVPRAHRTLLLDIAKAVFNADGVIDPKERESFELLEQLLV